MADYQEMCFKMAFSKTGGSVIQIGGVRVEDAENAKDEAVFWCIHNAELVEQVGTPIPGTFKLIGVRTPSDQGMR